MFLRHALAALALGVVTLVPLASADAACCYFRQPAQLVKRPGVTQPDVEITQPAQKVFITWDPAKQVETFTVQPMFEGNALEFGMVIPTPSQPKLHEMPRDFFKHLAVYTLLKHVEWPESKFVLTNGFGAGFGGGKGAKGGAAGAAFGGGFAVKPVPPPVEVLESGLVGALDYKIIAATRADELFKWLKDNRYQYAGDETTLNFYVQKKWFFTVMKIDTMQMKKNRDGSYNGEVTPTRFQFTSEELVYPLRITQISVPDQTEALFYIQSPTKVDLEGEFSYQYTWVPMLQTASAKAARELPGRGEDWLKAIAENIPRLLKDARRLDYKFEPGKLPKANAKGRTPTAIEWAKRLTAQDIGILTGKALYSEKMPDVDDGITEEMLRVAPQAKHVEIAKILKDREAKAKEDRPNGYLVRSAAAEDIKELRQLAGHLQEGMFITKLRKTFTRDEMNDDLVIVEARVGVPIDRSEYVEKLPTTPP